MDGDDAEAPGLHEARLLELASALFSTDPARKQIVVASRAEQAERSVVAEPVQATLVLDTGGKIRACDELAQKLLGLPESELVGRDVSAVMVDASRPGEPGVKFAPDRGAHRLVILPEVMARRRDGTTFPVDISGRRMMLDGREHFLIAFDDLLVRKAAEEPMQRAQARYRALVEQIPAVTFMCALDEGLSEMYVSPQIEKMMGYSAEEWLDSPVLWYWRLHPDDRDMWTNEFARGVATGGPFRAECRVMARDGHIVWIHGEAWLVRDDAGRPIMLQGICFDISESKRAEEAIKEAQALKIRTERLAAIGQLAASIGHDLRNPLTAVRNAYYFLHKRLGTTELVKEDRTAQFLAVMDKELKNCSRIISDLLDFARQRPVTLSSVSLAALVKDAVSVIPCPAHVAIVVEVAEDAPTVDVDQDQFRQVLINLIQNGAEAIPAERPGRVTVKAAFEPDVVQISVEDNGSGIPEELREKIFEPLFTNKPKGTGLGLPIVSNILTKHGFLLDLTSTVGQGSTFHIKIRRQPAPAR